MERFREPVHVLRERPDGRIGIAFDGEVTPARYLNGHSAYPLLATLPALYPEWLGDRSFQETHGVRFPYIAGAMANGIATTDLVIAMARAHMLGFFGAAGLPFPEVERALGRLELELGGTELAWGMNLIHSPNEPALEEAVADLLLRRGVRRVSASAYLGLTPAIVRYAVAGLAAAPDGSILRHTHVFAKISRPETARHFLSPAPGPILEALVSQGKITAEQARLAARVPLAEDITVEADSGGHTDRQSLSAVFGTIAELRDELSAQHDYPRPVRVGAAGGLGTPRSVAGAFSLGAAYVLTGSVNQSAIEAGVCEAAKRMLAEASSGDVVMAPAADMFEQGVEVQVLKRGTMFGNRAHRLRKAYRDHASLDAIPSAERTEIEKRVLSATFDEVRAATRSFWAERDPSQNDIAARDPKHEMALCFRWYLGLSSRWAIKGDEARKLDYQLWCGPAMGAFNAWVKGSFLEVPENRTVVQIALNLLEGAAAATRAHQLRSYGAPIPADAYRFTPRPLA
ncbi:MAG: PfaD family polyunsaturated fatty acid/polyketide biosynthesis protein [Sandaracinaceae bacterium]